RLRAARRRHGCRPPVRGRLRRGPLAGFPGSAGRAHRRAPAPAGAGRCCDAMREVLDDVERWRRAGRRVALARVVDVEGSGPRLPGAAMAVNEDGEVAGSVSGGCVEGAVVAEAVALLERRERGRLVSFGYSDDEAFAVGLTC